MSGWSFDQNRRHGTPWVVAKSRRMEMNRRNSSHVKGSISFVAWRIVVLKNSRSKKWRKKPKTVCIDALALTNVGCTFLTPTTFLASKGSLPHALYIPLFAVLVAFGIFSGAAGSLSSSTEKPWARKFETSSFKINGISRSTFLSTPAAATFSSFPHRFFWDNIEQRFNQSFWFILQNQATAWRIWPSSKSSCCIVKQSFQHLEMTFSSCPTTRRLSSTSFLVAFGYLCEMATLGWRNF